MSTNTTDTSVINDVELKNSHIRVIAWYNTSTKETKEIWVDDSWGMLSWDMFLETARWNLPWRSALNNFWLNDSVWTTEVSIWDGWSLYTWIDTASILNIQSTSTNDTSTWTWARTIKIQWLDEDYNEISEDIILNWTTTVNSINSYLRIHRIMVLTAWSWWEAEWTITAKIDWVTYAQIVNWNNQTLMAIYTIPAWKTWYLLSWKAATWKGRDATIKFKARPLWWVFNVKHVAYLVENSYDYTFNPPLTIPEKTDIQVTAIAGQASTSVSAVFDIILIDNA